MNFTHLHVHSHYSLLDGASKVDALLDRVEHLGMKAVALTDHGAMYGTIEFYKKARDRNIKPIIGVETYVAPRTLTDKSPRVDSKPYHLILLAENFEGYQNLLYLVTRAHIDGFYYKPRVDKELLRAHSKGIIATSACLAGEVPRALLQSYEQGKKVAEEYIEIFGKDNFFIELQHHPNVEEQVQVNPLLIKLAKELGLGLIATNDAHYVSPDDAEAQDVLTCIASGKNVSDTNRMNYLDTDLSITDTETMAEWFKDTPEVLSNTMRIAERCNVEIPMGKSIMPGFPVPKGENERSWLRKLCEKGVRDRYGFDYTVGDWEEGTLLSSPNSNDESVPLDQRVRERTDYELSVVEKMGFEGYFLITQDFINWARSQGILIGPGRGSAAGAMIGFLTGITDIDPIKYKLIFERFLNPERFSMPDIDNDIQDSRRDEVIEYVRNRYGSDHVAQIITFGTMQARNAIRDVGRVLGLPYQECDYIAKMIPFGMSMKEAMGAVDELKQNYDSNEQVHKLIDLATRLEGSARHTSIHAAGVVVTPEPIYRYSPMQHAARSDNAVVTQYEMHAVEDLGILKIDFLGLSNLNIIDLCLKLLRKHRNVDINIRTLETTDKAAYRLLSKAATTGVFQLESAGMKRYLKELKPSEFEDIISMVALYRPGPIDAIPDFIESKHGRKEITYLHPALKPILESTYGVIVTQDQVLQIARDFAGFTYGEADILRKAVGKKIKELLDEQREKFINGAMKTQGIPQELASRVWDFIEPFARYGFNRAHAACYAMIAYQTAFLKAHYPAEFMAALMTSDLTNLDRLTIELAEADQMGLKVAPPDVNESFVDFAVVYDTPDPSPKRTGNIIRFGLGAIKNVGVEVSHEIVEEREKHGPYKDLTDFLVRLGGHRVNKKVVENLAKAGALDSLAERNTVLEGLTDIVNFIGAVHRSQSSKDQIGLFSGEESGTSFALNLPKVPPLDSRTKLDFEKELLGIYLSDHPMKTVREQLGAEVQPLVELIPKMHNHKVRVAGLISTIRVILTKNNEPMAFVGIEDATNSIELIVFPRVYAETKDLWIEGTIVVVDGFVNAKDSRTQAATTEIKVLVESVWEVKNNEQLDLPPFAPQKRRERRQNTDGAPNAAPAYNPYSEPAPTIPATPTRFCITLPPHVSKELLVTLKDTLAQHPGDLPVVLRVEQPTGIREITTSARVAATPETKEAVAALMGQSAVH